LHLPNLEFNDLTPPIVWHNLMTPPKKKHHGINFRAFALVLLEFCTLFIL